VVAAILVQCRREADTRSPEAERHSVGAHRGHTATGAVVIGGLVVIGAVAIGMVATGMVAIGAAVIGGLVAIGAVATGAATNPFLSEDLVFPSSTGIPITVTIRTATVRTPMGTGMTLPTVTAMIITALPLTGTDTTAVKATATAVKATGTATKATGTATRAMAMATGATAMTIKAKATTIKPTAMAIDLRLSSYSAD